MSARPPSSFVMCSDILKKLNKFWEFPVDNKFAEEIFHETNVPEILSHPLKAAKLCGKCQKMDFWTDSFRFTDTLPELERQSTACDFCKMRWNLCKDLNARETSTIRFDRLDSMLRMNEAYPPVLSLCRGPGKLVLHFKVCQETFSSC